MTMDTLSEIEIRRPVWTRSGLLALLGCVVAVLFLLALMLGPVSLSIDVMRDAVVAKLTGADAPDIGASAILFEIRAPRALLGIAVGASLALSGAVLQGLFRNPLADPGLIGVSAGATLGAVCAISLGGAIGTFLPFAVKPYLVPFLAFIGALGVTAVIFALARRQGTTSVATLLLAGIAINAIAMSIVGGFIFASDDRELRDITFWTMGSLGGADWWMTLIAMAVALTAGFGLMRLARPLDLLQLGERAAFHAGVSVERVKALAAVLTALAVGAATAAAGPIGFIGLVGPHIARLIIGAEHRLVLLASMLCGAALVLAADLAVRLAIPPAELPIGLATSVIGGPFFLYLLLTRRRGLGDV